STPPSPTRACPTAGAASHPRGSTAPVWCSTSSPATVWRCPGSPRTRPRWARRWPGPTSGPATSSSSVRRSTTSGSTPGTRRWWPPPTPATSSSCSRSTRRPSPPPGGSWADRLPPAGRRFAGAIEQAANAAGIDPRLLAAVAWTESGFNPGAVSGTGAVGLTQLMPATAAGLGVDAADPYQNLLGGARYLAGQLQRFGRVDHALAAYNAGPTAVT